MAYPRQNYSIPIGAFDEYDQPAAGVFSVREKANGTKMQVSCRSTLFGHAIHLVLMFIT